MSRYVAYHLVNNITKSCKELWNKPETIISILCTFVNINI